MCYTLSVTFTILLISLRHLESVKLKILLKNNHQHHTVPHSSLLHHVNNFVMLEADPS